MANSHNKSFFGQSTGLILQSSSKTDPSIFFQCIKRKSNGNWEKPSKGEGKNVKCSMEEIVMILQVLNHNEQSWSTYHRFNNLNTQISFNWDPSDEQKLWIHIGEYSKMLDFSQIEILRMLLTHILEEKIEYATSANGSDSSKDKKESKKNEKRNNHNENKFNLLNQKQKGDEIRVEESIEKFEPSKRKESKKIQNQYFNEETQEYVKITATIKRETDKALLLLLDSGNEVWIPKSGINSNYVFNKDISQTFLIQKWILLKNNILS